MIDPAKAEAELRAAWAASVSALRKTLGDLKVDELIRAGRLEGALTEAALDKALAPVRSTLGRVAKVGAKDLLEDAAQGIPKAVGSIDFTPVLAPAHADAIRVLDAKLLKNMKEDVRETVRKAVAAGLVRGEGPETIARGLREIIGTYPAQEVAAQNYRRALEEGDAAKALSYKLRDRRFDKTTRKGNLSPAEIEKRVAAYRKQAKVFHADTIARTAVNTAYESGRYAGFQAALRSGRIDPNRSRKRWIATKDTRVRDEHKAMNGETVAWNENFSNGLEYPQEYNCRCTLAYEMTPIAPPGPPVPAGKGVRPPGLTDAQWRAQEKARQQREKAALERFKRDRDADLAAAGLEGQAPAPIVVPPPAPPAPAPPAPVAPVVSGLSPEVEAIIEARINAAAIAKAKKAAQTAANAKKLGITTSTTEVRRTVQETHDTLVAPTTAEENRAIDILLDELADKDGAVPMFALKGTDTPYDLTKPQRERLMTFFRSWGGKKGLLEGAQVEARVPVELPPQDVLDSVHRSTNNYEVSHKGRFGDDLAQARRFVANIIGETDLDDPREGLVANQWVDKAHNKFRAKVNPRVGGAHNTTGEIVFGSLRGPDTMAHEMLHSYEGRNAALIKAMRTLQVRISGSSVIAHLPSHDRTVRGSLSRKFFREYMGRTYQHAPLRGGPKYGFNSEMMSVFADAMYNNPLHFATEFPETFRAMMTVFMRLQRRATFYKPAP